VRVEGRQSFDSKVEAQKRCKAWPLLQQEAATRRGATGRRAAKESISTTERNQEPGRNVGIEGPSTAL